MHISIQEGRSLPDLRQCTTCCKVFHCPFCASNEFHPAKLGKVQTHLESHFKRAVLHEGYTIHRCALNCRPGFHFHCFYCQSMLTRKPNFIKHLALWKAKPSAITPIIPDPSIPIIPVPSIPIIPDPSIPIIPVPSIPIIPDPSIPIIPVPSIPIIPDPSIPIIPVPSIPIIPDSSIPIIPVPSIPIIPDPAISIIPGGKMQRVRVKPVLKKENVPYAMFS
ncbi:hypothetical protein OYC64_008200 [Pagothenia borchgrevinki]|uniref:C2H2-type domain-containing protein n=2 Tax=Pagothenia borchgrevinki TaxID=8213 RepID=A0ABD2GV62_PAGBO